MELKAITKEFLKPMVMVVGFSEIDRFSKAPEAHSPEQVCKDPKTVVVFGISVAQGMLRSPKYSLYAMHCLYHTVYPMLNEVSLQLCNFLEAQRGLAVPIPSYAPLVFDKMEP